MRARSGRGSGPTTWINLQAPVRLTRRSNGSQIITDPDVTIGAGGEATIHPVPGDPAIAVKVYRTETDRTAKLMVMLDRPPPDIKPDGGHVSVAWPIDLLVDEQDVVRGFVMPRIHGARGPMEYWNPGRRRETCPLFSWFYLHRTARNLAAAVKSVHNAGIVVGDINESNILVTETALVTLVDTDSFQIVEGTSEVTSLPEAAEVHGEDAVVQALKRGSKRGEERISLPRGGRVWPCPVAKPEYTPPELLKGESEEDSYQFRREEHDRFGLGVLIFQLLMEGSHPYAGRYPDHDGEPPIYPERILNGHFPHVGDDVPCKPLPITPPFSMLHPELRAGFIRCFNVGNHTPTARPSAEEWQEMLEAAEADLVTCEENSQHRFASHLDSCPWCERSEMLGGRDPFPSKQSVRSGRHMPADEAAMLDAMNASRRNRQATPASASAGASPSGRWSTSASGPGAGTTPAPQSRRAVGWTVLLVVELIISLVAVMQSCGSSVSRRRHMMEPPPVQQPQHYMTVYTKDGPKQIEVDDGDIPLPVLPKRND